jgi:transposase
LSQDSGLSRGDKSRNRRLARLRELVPVSNAVVGIDLADRTQSVVLVDTDSRVLARRRVSKRAWELGPVLDWARTQAHGAGFSDVTVACEPTGHRWRIIAQLADQHSMPMVCVQPLLVARSREAEDYTRDKTDEKDAVLIARLARELRCYLPEPPDATWARLRHLGVRRTALISEATACRLRLRDLLECCWPAVLDTAAQPLDSTTWRSCLAVVAQRCAGDPGSLRGLGLAAFTRLVRAQLPRWGGTRLCHRIVRAVFAALGDDTGVATQRPGGLERVGLVLADWHVIGGKLTDTQTRMLAVLDELGLTDLLGSIPGLSPIAAAAILAETGDPTRFSSPRALVKHAGLNPQQNTSGTLRGKPTISKRGRPGLRTAAWRAVWGALPANPVLAARYQHLTTRAENPLSSLQAHIALAAALLRWIYVVTTRRQPWNPAIATGTHPGQHSQTAA